jgi:hypothetical protein
VCLNRASNWQERATFVPVIEVQQHFDLSGDLKPGWINHEPSDRVVTLEHASVSLDHGLAEAQISTWWEVTPHLVDGRLVGVEVDRRYGNCERVELLGAQRRADRRQQPP